MKHLDCLVESVDGKYFHLASRTDGRDGMAAVLTMDRLPGLLEETGLDNSFVAQYASQLAMHGAVDRNLLILEGPTIMQEVRDLYKRTEKTNNETTGFRDVWAVPEDKAIWWMLSGNSHIQVLDRNGYLEPGPYPYYIKEPDTIGASFVRPSPIAYPSREVLEIVRANCELRDNPEVTHYTTQKPLLRDNQNLPVHVGDEYHITVGTISRLGSFKPYVTLLEPLKHDKV
ncbi:MAG TPA: hypothetical protein VLE73_03385 [Candidatus Saccharimonadales bacterium]|nr:hypothetical protein [Candidatus Saccharimonadales bacterium]